MLNVERISSVKMGENAYVLYDIHREDCIVIDPGEENIAAHPLFKAKKVGAVLLTHGHFDHIQGINGLLAEGDGSLYVHKADEPMLYSSHLNLSASFGAGFTIDKKAIALQKEGPLTIGEGLTFKVLHTPGHTKGSLCYQIEGLLFTGDTLFERGYGRVDFPGGSMEEMEASLQRLLQLPDDIKVYPGHGSPSTILQCRASFKGVI